MHGFDEVRTCRFRFRLEDQRPFVLDRSYTLLRILPEMLSVRDFLIMFINDQKCLRQLLIWEEAAES